MSPLSVVIIYHLIVISGVAASSLRTVQCGLPFSALGVGTAAVEPSPDTSLLSDDEYLDYNVWTCVLPDLPVTLTSATLSLDLEPESWAQLPDHPPVSSSLRFH